MRVYKIELDGSVLFCREAKKTLVFQNETGQFYVKLYWDGMDALVLDTVQIPTQKSYAESETQAFQTWIRELLEPCFYVAFSFFPQASTLEIPGLWKILYGAFESAHWTFGLSEYPCSALSKLTFEMEEYEEDRMWGLQDCSASRNAVVLRYE